ncbi:Acetyltransferase [uncultured virus]|nr:Acetyltransferase [uncultured virus]
MELGAHSYGTINVRRWTSSEVVKIGKFCSLASNIRIVLDGNHKMDTFSTYPFHEKFGWTEYPRGNWSKETPIIGNDVWIADDVVIYSGCMIGDGAVIAGQSVVTKSVPPYAVVAGNPARIVKYRFNPETIRELLEYKWWDLPLDVIRTRLIPHAGDMQAVLKELREIRQATPDPN